MEPWQRSQGCPKRNGLGGEKDQRTRQHRRVQGLFEQWRQSHCNCPEQWHYGLCHCGDLSLQAQNSLSELSPLLLCAEHRQHLQLKGTGHTTLPIPPPCTLPRMSRLWVLGVLCGVEPSLIVSFCRTSWLLGWVRPVRSGTSQRQVRPCLLQCGPWLPWVWGGTAKPECYPRHCLVGGTHCWAGGTFCSVLVDEEAQPGQGPSCTDSQVTHG